MSDAPLATGARPGLIEPIGSRVARSDFFARLRANSEYVAIPLLALAIAALLFALFLLAIGKSPLDFVAFVWRGGFGTAFSFQNTLQRSAPLILTALAVAIPARIGLIMIGGEGALVLGGFAAAALAIPLVGRAPPLATLILMALLAMAVGAFWVGVSGFLRYARGVNETISSLLLTYIGIAIMNFFVEGSLRDLSNPNKPSTMPIGETYMVGKIPWNPGALGIRVRHCPVHRALFSDGAHNLWFRRSGHRWQFPSRARARTARRKTDCRLFGHRRPCAGLAGFFEVAAIQGRANASLAAGYGFTGILVSFLARHNPLVIPPVAILFGGLVASGGLIQRRMDLPDATVLVLQGFIFVVLLTSETLYGRFSIFRSTTGPERT